MNRTFRINAPSVVSEIIDGEAVIMNLGSGHYFSTQDTGCRIWSWIEEGRSRDEILHALAAEFDGDALERSGALDAFLAELTSHELIVPLDAETSVPAASANGASASDTRRPFSRPVLNVYSDMQDLLLLDPASPTP